MLEPSRDSFEKLLINADMIFKESFPQHANEPRNALYRAIIGDGGSINNISAPSEDNVDFLALFAYNQFNSQAPANEFLYSNLVKAVVQEHGIKPPKNIETFFFNFHDILCSKSLKLTERSPGLRSPDYKTQLLECSKNADLHKRAMIPNGIRKLYKFMQFFDLEYNGDVNKYIAAIGEVPSGSSMERHAVSVIQKLVSQNICGFAIACNFLKDVKANSFDHKDLHNRTIPYLFFLKPDLHLISAAVDVACPPSAKNSLEGRSAEDQNISRLQNMAENSAWLGGTITYGQNREAMKMRVLDIFYTWAKNARTTPFVLDRIIYMCQSGNTPFGKLKGSNEDRSRKLFNY